MISLKTAALAATLLVATVSGSFAATMDNDAKLLDGPHKWSDTVSYVDEGDYVKLLDCGFGKYCFVKIDGDKGYVRKSDIDFGNNYDNDDDYDVKFCFGSYYGGICLKS